MSAHFANLDSNLCSVRLLQKSLPFLRVGPPVCTRYNQFPNQDDQDRTGKNRTNQKNGTKNWTWVHQNHCKTRRFWSQIEVGGTPTKFFFANLRKTSLGGWAGKFSEATLSVHNRTNSIRQIENFVFAALVDVHGVENDTEQLTYAGSTFTTGNMWSPHLPIPLFFDLARPMCLDITWAQWQKRQPVNQAIRGIVLNM